MKTVTGKGRKTMKRFVLLVLFFLMSSIQVSYSSDQRTEIIGGDHYVASADSVIQENVGRDAFISGFSATISGDIDGDAHAAGFDVRVNSKIGGDLYAAGSNISIESAVAEDLTAAGFSIRLNDAASVGGNARISGGTIRVDGPIAGSLMAAGGSVNINALIAGDVRVTAGNISFGPNAKITGKFVYSTSERIEVPVSVISQENVTYRPIEFKGLAADLKDAIPSFWPSFLGVLFSALVTLAFLIIVSAIFLAFTPDHVERLKNRAMQHSGTSILLGFVGLATLIGMVPVSAMTLVGIPLIPIVILVIIAMWIIGYLLGVYAIAWRIACAFREVDETNTTRLIVIALAIVCLAALNFIPFIGALANFLLVLLGLGSITASLIRRLTMLAVFDEPVLAKKKGQK